MEKWGLFVTKEELDESVRLIEQAGFDIFEVRPLTFMEMLTYIGNDIRQCSKALHVIMFNATKEAYENFINNHECTRVF